MMPPWLCPRKYQPFRKWWLPEGRVRGGSVSPGPGNEASQLVRVALQPACTHLRLRLPPRFLLIVRGVRAVQFQCLRKPCPSTTLQGQLPDGMDSSG